MFIFAVEPGGVVGRLKDDGHPVVNRFHKAVGFSGQNGAGFKDM